MPENKKCSNTHLWLNCSIDREREREKNAHILTNVHEMGQFGNHLNSHAIFFMFVSFLTRHILVQVNCTMLFGMMKFVPHRLNDSKCTMHMHLFWQHSILCVHSVSLQWQSPQHHHIERIFAHLVYQMIRSACAIGSTASKYQIRPQFPMDDLWIMAYTNYSFSHLLAHNWIVHWIIDETS